jgi:replicative DNA helicase
MASRDYIEKALLLGVVREKNWKLMIKNNMDIKYFSVANHKLYQFIKDAANSEAYPEFQTLQYRFGIDDVSLQEYLNYTDYQRACDALKDDYTVSYLNYATNELNEHQNEMDTDPQLYIERLGRIYNDAKLLNHKVQAVDLFDNIEGQLGNKKETISTGFKELDEKLVGWQRGEELVVFMGRTGQGKSWLGLKFAITAALAGERVGIYSGEMSQEQLQERIICCAKQTHTTTREEAIAFIREKNLSIPIITQKELRRRATVDDIETFIVDTNLTMLVIDQLSLMEDNTSKPGTPLRQQYGNISMDLFTLSSKYSIPVILLVQSNRQGGENKDGPALENIAESDAVAQNATRVISMKNDKGMLTLNILKNRYGSSAMTQRYEVDFGINKFKPIQEINTQVNMRKPTRNADSMFRSNRTF